MIERYKPAARARRTWGLAAAIALGASFICAQTPAPPAQQPPPEPPKITVPGQTPKTPSKPGTETNITPEQAKELFSLVDQLIQFSSQETGLPIKSAVKRELTNRIAVETYLTQKFQEDEGAKRLQRGEIVLKKFGMLDHDFDLKPFLLALLKEQIEAYYDSKTKTVNLLDWVDVDEQKPVLAHELTHALQDQHINLEKWSDQTPSNVSTNYRDDTDHLAKDEVDTAREAVAEGQATAVMMDNILKPMGKSLLKDPEVVEFIKQQMTGSDNSPVMARAPLLLSESLLFPYREGLSFEQDIWMDKGQKAAFVGTLDLGDHQSPRIREGQGAHRSPPARHSSHRRQHLQTLRHRSGRPVGSAHPHRALRRRQRRTRPHPLMGWRNLLGRSEAQRQNSRGLGKHQIRLALLLVCVEKRSLRTGIRQALLQRAGPQVLRTAPRRRCA